MNFNKLLKTVNSDNFKQTIVDVNKINAQYNPSRFKYWKSLHKGPENKVLNMLYSPHYRFLKQYKQQNIKNTSYYKLQKLYGRDHKWIKNKIDKFINLFESIKNEGCKEKIIILSKPLVKNKYNDNLEIYEGHHRVACFLNLNIYKILCNLYM